MNINMDAKRALLALTTTLAATVFCLRPAMAQDDWEYTIGTYIWGTGIDGTVGAGGNKTDIDVNFSDIAKFADMAGSLHFEGDNTRWGYYGDIWFASLSDEDTTPLGRVKVNSDQIITEAGGMYFFREALAGYLGLRYQNVSGNIEFLDLGQVGAGEHWIDAVVGGRWTPAITKKFWAILSADVGTGDSDLTWLGQGAVEYKISRRWSGGVMYRHLSTNVSKNGFTWDVGQSGWGFNVIYHTR